MVRDSRKYILWDPSDGRWATRGDDGDIISDGLVGRMGADNVYLTTYASYPEGAKPIADLDVGDRIQGVRFSLSGTSGTYDVYRVS